MYLSVGMPYAHEYDVVDQDTGEKLQYVQWANDVTGEYGVLEMEEVNGIRYAARASNGMHIITLKKGNIKLVRQNDD